MSLFDFLQNLVQGGGGAQPSPVPATPTPTNGSGGIPDAINALLPPLDPAQQKRRAIGKALAEFGSTVAAGRGNNFWEDLSMGLPAGAGRYHGEMEKAEGDRQERAKAILSQMLGEGRLSQGQQRLEQQGADQAAKLGILKDKLDLMWDANSWKKDQGQQGVDLKKSNFGETVRHNTVTEGQGQAKIDESISQNDEANALAREQMLLREKLEKNRLAEAKQRGADAAKAAMDRVTATQKGKADSDQVSRRIKFEELKLEARKSFGLDDPGFGYKDPAVQDAIRKEYQSFIDGAMDAYGFNSAGVKKRAPSDDAIAKPTPVPQSEAPKPQTMVPGLSDDIARQLPPAIIPNIDAVRTDKDGNTIIRTKDGKRFMVKVSP